MIPPPKKKVGPPPPKVKQHRSIHIQRDLLELGATGSNSDAGGYTSKILAPIYKPRNKKPNAIELVNLSKAKKLIKKIESSEVSAEEKTFLIAAAQRHNVFQYKLVADYYAHASKPMQALMEDSALVIIDFDSAIQKGYVKFTDEIKELYVAEYEKSK
jgi:hypothetical protein